MFETTPIYALPAAAIYLALWMRVTAFRGSNGVSIGDAGNPVRPMCQLFINMPARLSLHVTPHDVYCVECGLLYFATNWILILSMAL